MQAFPASTPGKHPSSILVPKRMTSDYNGTISNRPFNLVPVTIVLANAGRIFFGDNQRARIAD
jgi:hypothetical protein